MRGHGLPSMGFVGLEASPCLGRLVMSPRAFPNSSASTRCHSDMHSTRRQAARRIFIRPCVVFLNAACFCLYLYTVSGCACETRVSS